MRCTDDNYDEFLEKVLKVNHPYEYALLKSDLKENMKKRPWTVKRQNLINDEHTIMNKKVRDGIRWQGPYFY